MPFLALLTYLSFVLIRPQEFYGPLIDLPVIKLSLIIAALTLFFLKDKRIDAPQVKCLVMLIPIIFLSYVSNGWAAGGIANVQKFVTTAILPFIVCSIIVNTERKQVMMMRFMIVAMVVMVSDGIAQKNSPEGIGWSGSQLSQGTRISYLGILNDPNDLGMFLVMMLPIIVFMYQHAGIIMKLVYTSALGMGLYGIYLTNSRGALLGTLAMLAFWAYLRYGWKKFMALAMLGGPAALVVMSKFRSIDSEEESAAGRLDAWYEGFGMLIWKPLFGVGMEGFTDHHHLTAHNSFVLVFAELGLSGYFFWLAFIVFSVLGVLRVWHRQAPMALVRLASTTEQQIASALTYSFIGYLVTCFFLSRAYTPILYVFCGMMLACYYRVSALSEPADQFKVSAYLKLLLICFVGSLVSIYMMVRLFV